jgi:hypothetical protein
MKRVENRNLKAHARKVCRARKPCRAGADDCYARPTFSSRADALSLQLFRSCEFAVCCEAFKSSYCHGLRFLPEDAFKLALIFLRAHTAAHSRQIIFFFKYSDRSAPVVFRNPCYEAGYVYAYGAALYACGLAAIKAAFRLFYRLFI